MDGNTLSYQTYTDTITGWAYEDKLPESIQNDVLARHPGYELDGMRQADDPEFRDYYVEL